MGFLSRPTIVSITRPAANGGTETGYGVSVSYDFSTDAVQTLPLIGSGQTIQGTQFIVDTKGLGGPAVVPPFRSVQLFTTFAPQPGGASQSPDGDLYIQVSGTLQIVRIPPPALAYLSTFGNPEGLVLNGVYPIASTLSPKLNVLKGVNVNSGTMIGNIVATFYTFDLPPYSLAGYSSNPNI